MDHLLFTQHTTFAQNETNIQREEDWCCSSAFYNHVKIPTVVTDSDDRHRVVAYHPAAVKKVNYPQLEVLVIFIKFLNIDQRYSCNTGDERG